MLKDSTPFTRSSTPNATERSASGSPGLGGPSGGGGLALGRVVGAIPDLHARIDDMAAESDKVYARLTVTGTNTGRFFGAPPTGRSYEASMFDYARLEDGRLVERIQQPDKLSQLRQLYEGAAKKAGAAALAGATVLLVLRGLRGRRRRNAGGRARDPG